LLLPALPAGTLPRANLLACQTIRKIHSLWENPDDRRIMGSDSLN